MPAGRNDRGGSRAIDEDTAGALIRLKREMPRITVPALLEQMERRGLISSGAKLAPSTVYRFLHSQKLMNRGRSQPVDRRRFEAELPNDLWQSDAMHGPMLQAGGEVGGKNKKTYLFAFIDDMSRICQRRFKSAPVGRSKSAPVITVFMCGPEAPFLLLFLSSFLIFS